MRCSFLSDVTKGHDLEQRLSFQWRSRQLDDASVFGGDDDVARDGMGRGGGRVDGILP